jgi:hypothetical protein
MIEIIQPTIVRLALALAKADCPNEIILKALEGYYDDFQSPIDTPNMALVADLNAIAKTELATRAMNGEFDATRAEGEAWFKAHGKDVMTALFLDKP